MASMNDNHYDNEYDHDNDNVQDEMEEGTQDGEHERYANASDAPSPSLRSSSAPTGTNRENSIVREGQPACIYSIYLVDTSAFYIHI